MAARRGDAQGVAAENEASVRGSPCVRFVTLLRSPRTLTAWASSLMLARLAYRGDPMSAHNYTDITPDAIPTVYLLFAGVHGQDRRGTDDLVATLANPREATEAFRQLRLQLSNRDGWAELTAVSAGNMKRLGWFGRDQPQRSSLAALALACGDGTTSTTESTAGARKWRRRGRGSPTLSTPKVVAWSLEGGRDESSGSRHIGRRIKRGGPS